MAFNDVKNKAKIQQLINEYTISAGGDFHSDELDEKSFLHELNKNFKVTPKENGENSCELLEKIIKLSTVKVRGRLNAKEFKQNKFLSKLYENFEIERI